MCLTLHVKPFCFRLVKALKTSQGLIDRKEGWLLHLENQSGQLGWGEVSPLDRSELGECAEILKTLGPVISIEELEAGTTIWPSALAFGIGAALGELQGLIGAQSAEEWLSAPPSAVLLPTDNSLLTTLDSLLENQQYKRSPLSFKWKVAINSQPHEEELLVRILERLPINSRLRLDANAGWSREQAQDWAKQLAKEPRLEWVEQPLAAEDIQGLLALTTQIPIALDESLLVNPSLRQTWTGWQIRRPLIEGDPRTLLQELNAGIGYRVLSTAFETGIGRRWLNHLAALQQRGPTPTAPGLAPGWCPDGPLFSADPKLVWEAA